MTVQASSLLLCSLVAGAASTVALGIVALIQANRPAADLASGQTPPSEIALIITAAIFVVSWIAVAFAFCRDQVLYRVTAMQASVATVAAAQEGVRADFAALRRELAEYAEQRETDGFLHGRRAGLSLGTNTPGHGYGSGNTVANGPAAGSGPGYGNGHGNGYGNGYGNNSAHGNPTHGEVRPLHRVPPVD